MGKLYFKKNSNEEKSDRRRPKPETVQFLLNYSRALRVVDHKKMKFETFLN